MANTDFIEIDLDAAQDGVVPTIRDNLHDEDLKRAVDLIRRLARPAYEKRRAQLQPATLRPATRAQLPTRRGLLIEGERGIGKTSFLLALSATFNDEKSSRLDLNPTEPRVHALPLIDPSLISGDRTFIATVIANVLSEVERCTNPQPQLCDPRQRSARAELDKAVQGLHDGLIAESEDTWRGLTTNRQADGQFVDHLLRAARGGLSLADRFEAFTRLAADMLGADMLLQPLDDVDLAGPEAYTTLEAVRRYMTGPSLLPVVAGDLEQFISMVWERRLQDEKRGLKARPEGDGRGAASRSAELRRVAGKHIDKLLPPHHRFPLPTRRAEVLRRGVVMAPNGVELPVLGWVEGEPAPLKERCLIGQAEAMLAPSPSRLASRALLPLIPENTREMFSALRLLRDSISEFSRSATQKRAASVEALDRLGHLFAADLVVGKLRRQQLRQLAERGPQDDTLDALRQCWRVLGDWQTADRGRSTDMDVVAALINIAVSQWIQHSPVRQYILLGLHAPYLTPAEDGSYIGVRPEAVTRGVSPAAILLHNTVKYIDDTDNDEPTPVVLHPVGLWLRDASDFEQDEEPFFEALKALVEAGPAAIDLLRHINSVRTAGEVRHHVLNRLFLGANSLQRSGRMDAHFALSMARTSVKTEAGGQVWVVNPLQLLEAVARVVNAATNVLGDQGPTAESAIRSTLHSMAGSDFNYPRSSSLELRRTQADTHRAEATRYLDWIVAETKAWITKPHQQVSPGTISATYRTWLDGLHELGTDCELYLSTVGGYLQRTILSLFNAALTAELRAIGGPLSLNPNIPALTLQLWTHSHAEQDDYTVYEEDDVGPDDEGTVRWSPAGRFHELLQVIDGCWPDRSQLTKQDWAVQNFPLTSALVACPILAQYLSTQWLAALSMIWAPPTFAQSGAAPDVHTLLCGIPVPPTGMDTESLPTEEALLQLVGEGVLSIDELQAVRGHFQPNEDDTP